MKLAIVFTNLGPYHLARLRAAAGRLDRIGGRVVAYETAGVERKYPWRASDGPEPFERVTLFPGAALEGLPRRECARAIREALDRDRPDAVAVAGYVRAESLAAAAWARAHGLPAVLMSESQSIDRPRAWWKEAIKRRRVRRFDAALVGGPAHREYLEALGMPPDRIALGYNAVDNEHFASACARSRSQPRSRSGLPSGPYFLSVGRFVAEKNLERLLRAFATYRRSAPSEAAWDLVLCGGGELEARLDRLIRAEGLSGCVHRPGFLQSEELPRWYAHASAFVLPSLSEPWGLVVNEAAASGLPLLVSDRAGCARTLVPDPPGQAGWRLDPTDHEHITASLARMSACSEAERTAMGRRAAEIVAGWGPGRFASGLLDAVEMASGRRSAPGGPRARPLIESVMTNDKFQIQ